MPDITANRHQGSPESWAAYQKAHDAMPRQRADVLTHITTAADHGLTAKECAAKWAWESTTSLADSANSKPLEKSAKPSTAAKAPPSTSSPANSSPFSLSAF